MSSSKTFTEYISRYKIYFPSLSRDTFKKYDYAHKARLQQAMYYFDKLSK